MARTIEPGVSLLTSSEVRVAVLPVGPVPREALDDYYDLISRYHHVSLTATRSFYRGGGGGSSVDTSSSQLANKTPFQFIDWSNSYMRLRYLQGEDARRRTRVPDLHAQRQVLAIIGVVHCPMCTSVAAAHEEFKKICRNYPEALVHRCFVFEPSEEHIRQDGQQHFKDVVMFPPGGPSHLEQHLEVWMHDLVATVLTEFEKWMLTAGTGLIKLSSYADTPEFTGVAGMLDEMQKRLMGDGEAREKQRWARLMKMKGDMCLMCGSPRDAYEHYRSSHELAKACHDYVWVGAALEDMAAARLHEALLAAAVAVAAAAVPAAGGGGSSDRLAAVAGGAGGGAADGIRRSRSFSSVKAKDSGARPPHGGGSGRGVWEVLRRSDVEGQVRESFAEARLAYKRKGGVPPLMVEQHLKLARLAAGLRGTAARREVLECVAAVQELLPLLNLPEDRLAAVVECAQVLGLVGSSRKRVLLLWHAQELARGLGMERGEVLRIAARALEPPDDPRDQEADIVPKVHWSIRRAAAGGSGGLRCWDNVSQVLLEAALTAAKAAQAPAEAWEAAAALLREHHAAFVPMHQSALLETLSMASAALQPRARMRPGPGPGPIVQLKRLLPAAPPLQPMRMMLSAAGVVSAAASGGGGKGRSGGGGAGAGGPFIFNPYAEKRQANADKQGEMHAPEWVVGDEGRVEVYVINPLALPLKVDQLQLHVKYMGHSAGTGMGVAAGSEGTSPAGSATSLTKLSFGPGMGLGGAADAAGQRQQQSGAGAGAKPAKPFKTPSLNLLLPPNGRPHRLVLRGKPQLPGQYSIEGCWVTMWGVTWQVPFSTQLKKLVVAQPASAGGAGAVAGGGGAAATRGSQRAAAKSPTTAVNVLPQLPLLKAVIRSCPPSSAMPPPQPPSLQQSQYPQQQQQGTMAAASPQPADPPAAITDDGGSVIVQSPRDEDIRGPAAAGATFADDLHRGAAVAVHEGQVLSWSLVLTNIGGPPVTHASVVVSNQKGVPLKPLRGSQLPASFQGVHLEVDDTQLQQQQQQVAAETSGDGGSGLPLQANGCSVVLPLQLHVGQAPRGTFREVQLEVRIAYLHKAGGGSAAEALVPVGGLDASCSNPASPGAPLIGRRILLSLQFEVQPTLHVGSMAFFEHYAPLRDGARHVAVEQPLDPQQIIPWSSLPAGLLSSPSLQQYQQQPSMQAVGGELQQARPGPSGQRQGGDWERWRVDALRGREEDRLRGEGADPGGVVGPQLRAAAQIVPPRLYIASPAASVQKAVQPPSLAHRAPSTLACAFVAFAAVGVPAAGTAASSFSSAALSYRTQGSFAVPQQQHAGQAPGAPQPQPSPHHHVMMMREGSVSAQQLSSLRLAGLDLSTGPPHGAQRTASRLAYNSRQSAFAALGLFSAASTADNPLQLQLQRPPSLAFEDLRSPSAFIEPQLSATAPAGPAAALEPSPGGWVGLITDAVLTVNLQNASSHYFRAWLARIGEDPDQDHLASWGGCGGGADGSHAALAALGVAPALASSMEVLQPGDAVRLACVVPAAVLQPPPPGVQHDADSISASPSSPASRTLVKNLLVHSCGGAGSDGGSSQRVSQQQQHQQQALEGSCSFARTSAGESPSHQQQLRSLSAYSSLRLRRPMGLALSGGGLSTTAEAATPRGAVVELVEEADRMACAEVVAEGWAVVWEMVTTLSDAAAGRQPPRGLVRLAAVDIARSLTAAAVSVLQPSVLHFSFSASAPPRHDNGSAAAAAGLVGSCTGAPVLKDLSARLQPIMMGAGPAAMAGPVWGLDVPLGEPVAVNLLLNNRGTHQHHVTFSVAVVNVQQQQQQAAAAAAATATTGAAHDQHHHHQPQRQPHSAQIPSQHPPGAAPAGGHYGSHPLLYGQAGGGAGGGQHAGYSGAAGSYSQAPSEPGADPGAVLVGAVRGVHVVVQPGSTVKHPVVLVFVQPGLYQLTPYDVFVVPEGTDSVLSGTGGRPGQAPQPQRVYASVDRLNVLSA